MNREALKILEALKVWLEAELELNFGHTAAIESTIDKIEDLIEEAQADE